MKEYLARTTLLFVVALLVAASGAEASHFRGAQIEWQRLTGRTVQFTVTHAWRSSQLGDGEFVFGDASATSLFGCGSPSPPFTDGTGASYRVCTNVLTHTYLTDGPFNVQAFDSGNRISPLSNGNSNTRYRVDGVVDLRNNNLGGPISSLPFLIQAPMTAPGVFWTQPLSIVDPDQDAITCSFTPISESSLVSAVPNSGGKFLTLPGCVLTWDTSFTLVNQKYALQVIIAESSNGVISETRFDFIIEIVEGNIPTCDFTPQTVVLPPGATHNFNFVGSDLDGGDLTVQYLGTPSICTPTPPNDTTGPEPLNSTVSCTVPPGAFGQAYAGTVIYKDATNLQAVCSYSISVPADQPPTCNAGGPYFAVCNAASLDAATATDPNNDPLTYVWSSTVAGVAFAPGSGNVNVNGTVPLSQVTNPNYCNSTVPVVLTVSASGTQSATCLSQVTFVDNLAPVINGVPASATVECSAIPSAPSLLATDNCAAPAPAVFGQTPLSGNNCNGTITRTWTAVDSCTNQSVATQVLTVRDTTAPVLSATPVSTVVPCDNIPPAPVITATDNCDTTVPVQFVETPTPASCPGQITRRWSAQDDCGNAVVHTQVLALSDLTPPVVQPIASINVACIESVPASNPAIVSATDNCDASPTAVHLVDLGNGSCPRSIERRYRVTDACGNATHVSQTIIVDDVTRPVVAPLPPMTVECAAQIPPVNVGLVSYTENCAAGATVTHVSDVSNGQSCPGLVARTYRVTDVCGNFTNVVQLITVHDTMPPVVASLPPIVLQCIEDVPAADTSQVMFTENCFVASTVTHVGDVSDGRSCPQTITRTYRVVDGCGNSTDVRQTITIHDVTPPVVPNLPPIVVECIEDVPAADAAIVGFVDNCVLASVVTHVSDVSDGGRCPEVVTRTYRVVDGCGNATDVVQTITVDDVTPPVVDPLPDVLVQCMSDVPAANPAMVTYSSNCVGNTMVSHEGDVHDGQLCPRTIVRTYRVVDSCGNTVDVTQTFVVDDSIPPVVTPLPRLLLTCTDDVPTADPSVVVFTENCSGTAVVTHEGDVDDGQTCPATITRTYRVVDACGHAVDVNQEIVINDPAGPVISGVPADVAVECDSVPEPAQPTVADNCQTSPTLDYQQLREDGNCADNYILRRVWTATDGCGNVSVATQVLTVQDTTAPVVTGLLEPTAAMPPSSATSPNSVCAPASHREFRVICEANDNCDDMPVVTAKLRAARTVVGPNSTCTAVVEEVVVACDDVVEIVLLAAPCAASSAASGLPANSTGVVVVAGERVTLTVTAEDRCGNVGTDTFDPANEPPMPCEEVLDDGTCCPVIGQPPSDCDGACGLAINAARHSADRGDR